MPVQQMRAVIWAFQYRCPHQPVAVPSTHPKAVIPSIASLAQGVVFGLDAASAADSIRGLVSFKVISARRRLLLPKRQVPLVLLSQSLDVQLACPGRHRRGTLLFPSPAPPCGATPESVDTEHEHFFVPGSQDGPPLLPRYIAHPAVTQRARLAGLAHTKARCPSGTAVVTVKARRVCRVLLCSRPVEYPIRILLRGSLELHPASKQRPRSRSIEASLAQEVTRTVNSERSAGAAGQHVLPQRRKRRRRPAGSGAQSRCDAAPSASGRPSHQLLLLLPPPAAATAAAPLRLQHGGLPEPPG